MAKRHSTAHARISAVGYLRRSTSKQEKSLADQRKEIERYAAEHGYEIRRWFQDDGISGDATEKRAGFLALHKAACNGRDFDVILVWDQDRFGRFNSLEAGYWIHPLMRAGVRLDTVTDGPINWDDFTGRVMYGLKQEGKYQFLRDLSRNVTRGQISNAHPALVDRKTFARVQAKLTERKGRTGPKSKCGDGYILTGLVHCAHCGAKMYGTKLTVKRHGKQYVYHKYICSTYHTKGKHQCGYNNVAQDLLLSFLVRRLRDAVLCGGQREALRKHLKALAEAERQPADPIALARQRAKLADLEAQIAHGTKRLLKAPDDVADLLGAELARLRRERDRLAADLDAAEHRQAGDTEADIEAALDELWTLADGLESDEPAILREVIRRLVSRIDLWFDAKQNGPRIERPLSKGVIDLRPEAVAFKLDSRGDWI